MMSITPASDAWAFGLVAFGLFASGGALNLFPDEPKRMSLLFMKASS